MPGNPYESPDETSDLRDQARRSRFAFLVPICQVLTVFLGLWCWLVALFDLASSPIQRLKAAELLGDEHAREVARAIHINYYPIWFWTGTLLIAIGIAGFAARWWEQRRNP